MLSVKLTSYTYNMSDDLRNSKDYVRKSASSERNFTISLLLTDHTVSQEINARYHKKLPMPLPWEFVVVIITTVASHYGLLYENHDVSVVGDIPTG